MLSWSLSHSHHRFFCSAGLLQEREGAPGDGTESRSPAGLGTLPDTQSPFPAGSERDGEGAWALPWWVPVISHHTGKCPCPLKDSTERSASTGTSCSEQKGALGKKRETGSPPTSLLFPPSIPQPLLCPCRSLGKPMLLSHTWLLHTWVMLT